MIEQHQELYIPADERSLRRAQRRVHELDKGVRDWAQSVIAILPRGLAILEDEAQILALYLAQQRRLNLEMDARSGDEQEFSARGPSDSPVDFERLSKVDAVETHRHWR